MWTPATAGVPRVTVCLLLVGAAVAVAACGGSSDESGRSGTASAPPLLAGRPALQRSLSRACRDAARTMGAEAAAPTDVAAFRRQVRALRTLRGRFERARRSLPRAAKGTAARYATLLSRSLQSARRLAVLAQHRPVNVVGSRTLAAYLQSLAHQRRAVAAALGLPAC